MEDQVSWRADQYDHSGGSGWIGADFPGGRVGM